MKNASNHAIKHVYNTGNKEYHYFSRVFFTENLGNELVLLLIMRTLPIAPY
jgi:hypothetical protein